jgi:putative nucleotidyltransferase with HDIG domain
MAALTLDALGSSHAALLRAVQRDVPDGTQAVVVGGAVRDARLGARRRAAIRDLDVAVPRGAFALARRLADRVGGAFVPLDEARGAARVVAGDTRVDVTDFRAPTLEDDLRLRDFTVNALAVSLDALVARGRAAIVDPTGGLADLRARRLRVPDPHVLADDPLRALRGVRLEADLGLALTPATARAIRAIAPRLGTVSAERVRDEVLAILRLRRSGRAVRRLGALGLLRVVVPEVEAMRTSRQPAPHRFGVLEHSLRTLDGADRLLARLDGLVPHGPDLAAHVQEALGGGIRRADVLKLAALLHDVAKPETRRAIAGRVRFFEHDTIGALRARAIGERLRLPDRAVALLERLVRHHLRPMHLAQAGQITRRARYRFFRDLGDDARDLLLLTLVDAAAVTGASPFAAWRRATVVRLLLGEWSEDAEVAATAPLVRGGDVMRRFGLPPGPDVGRLLRRAREAQDLGLVGTPEEALAWLADPGTADADRARASP